MREANRGGNALVRHGGLPKARHRDGSGAGIISGRSEGGEADGGGTDDRAHLIRVEPRAVRGREPALASGRA